MEIQEYDEKVWTIKVMIEYINDEQARWSRRNQRIMKMMMNNFEYDQEHLCKDYM